MHGTAGRDRSREKVSWRTDSAFGAFLLLMNLARRRWEAHIMQTLANRPEKKSDYVILRSEQLVGTALIILVKTTHIMAVRNVEASTKKVDSFPRPLCLC
jgi:hypothetical protein